LLSIQQTNLPQNSEQHSRNIQRLTLGPMTQSMAASKTGWQHSHPDHFDKLKVNKTNENLHTHKSLKNLKDIDNIFNFISNLSLLILFQIKYI